MSGSSSTACGLREPRAATSNQKSEWRPAGPQKLTQMVPKQFPTLKDGPVFSVYWSHGKHNRLYCISLVISPGPKPLLSKPMPRSRICLAVFLPKTMTRAGLFQLEIGSCSLLLQAHAGSGNCPGLCLIGVLFVLFLFISSM